MGTLKIIDSTGHTQLQWEVQDEEQTAVARGEFERLLMGGHVAYGYYAGQRQGEVLQEFDPAADRIAIRPHAAGG